MALKLDYLEALDLGGAMIWAMALDTFLPQDAPVNALQSLIAARLLGH